MLIMSLNVGIWTRNRKRTDANYWKRRAQAMCDMIKVKNPDIICFQEMWWPHNLFVPKGYRRIGGTSPEHPIYCRKGLKVSRRMWRTYFSFAEIDGVDVYNVHSHWNAKINTEVCRDIADMYRYQSAPRIIAGDFNNSLSVLAPILPGVSHARTECGLPLADTFLNFTRPESHGEIDHIFTNGVRVLDFSICHKIGCVRISDHGALLMNYSYI